MIKKMRNALLSPKRKVMVCITPQVAMRATMQHIRTVFEKDQATPGLKYLHKLTVPHVSPNNWEKMRVRLAAQVLSASVARGLRMYMHDRGTEHMCGTAEYVKRCNDWFDVVNCHGAITLENMHQRVDELKAACGWFIQQRKFADQMSTGDESMFLAYKTVFDIELTMLSFEGLITDFMQLYSGSGFVIYPGRFNQDPLENFFGHIRAKGGHNKNPMAVQYGPRLQQIVAAGVVSVRRRGNTGAQKRKREAAVRSELKQAKPAKRQK